MEQQTIGYGKYFKFPIFSYLYRSWDVLVENLAAPKYSSDIWHFHRYKYIRHTYHFSLVLHLNFFDYISSYIVGFF